MKPTIIIAFFFYCIVIHISLSIVHLCRCAAECSNQDDVSVSFFHTGDTYEYFRIKGHIDGADTIVFDSLIDSHLTDICLPKSSKREGNGKLILYQYELECYTTEGIQWNRDSILEIRGEYGNTFYRNTYTPKTSLSLYYGIGKLHYWDLYMKTNVPSNWYTGGNNWDSIRTIAVIGKCVANTIYMTKSFTIPSDMVGFEIGLSYEQGIVAYLNGIEFHRDNMADGPVSYDTHAISTSDVYFHRFGFPVSLLTAQSYLSVELHWKSDCSMPFDAYLFFFAANVDNTNCFIYPYPPTTEASLYDLNIGSGIKFFSNFSFDYYFSNAAVINGFRLYPNGDEPVLLSQLQVQTKRNNNWISVLTRSDLTLPKSKFSVETNPLITEAFYSYHFSLNGYYEQTINEIQPLICNLDVVSSVSFSQELFTFHTKYESINVHPTALDFTNCSISPSPAEGLSFDSATCTLTGRVDNALERTLYNVTSIMNDIVYSGQFEIEVVDCMGSNVEFELSGFENYNFDYSVEFGPVNGQLDPVVFNIDHKHYFCLTEMQYSVKLGSVDMFWPPGFLYVNVLFSETEKETVLRANYDLILGTKPTIEFSLNYIVKPNELWYYRNSTIISNSWYSENPSTWSQASTGNYPTPEKYLQFYQRSFLLSTNDITHSAGIVISLRYQYDFVIYINGKSVLNHGFSLSESPSVNNDAESADFKQITIPIVNPSTHEDIIVTNNVIAIGLKVKELTSPSFDCAIRLIKERSVSRSFNIKMETNSIANVFDQHHKYSVSNIDYLVATFENNRFEWITSMSVQLYRDDIPQQNPSLPKNIVVEVKRSSNDWETLANKNLSWSLQGQRTHIWIVCDQPYSQFRLRIIGSNDGWRVGYLDFILDAMKMPTPPLSYGTNDITLFTDIEMGEVYPDFADGYEYCYYYDFEAVGNCLPEGIVVDQNSGVISGTSHATLVDHRCKIRAHSFLQNHNQYAEKELKITVKSCHDGESLITLVALSDAYPQNSKYSIENTEIVSSLHMPSNLNYGDFCLADGYYTLNLLDTSDHGWNNPAGYYITVDVGEMEISVGQVYDASQDYTKTKLVFSSAMPFQVNYSEWDLYTGVEAIPNNWNTFDYKCDSNWMKVSKSNFNTSKAITVYVRKEFDKTPGKDTDHVLNVRVKYSGGLIAYVNGHRVARFNLPAIVDSSTLSLKHRDADEVEQFSKFHVILDTVDFREEKNVIAFEIHKDVEAPSEYTVTFDATGVFGVKDTLRWNNQDWECSVVVDSYTWGTNDENYFSLLPLNKNMDKYHSFPEQFDWRIQNLEGSKFNSFGFQSPYNIDDVSFVLRGERLYEEDDERSDNPYEILYTSHLTANQQSRVFAIDPRGMMSLNTFHLSRNSDPIQFNTFVPQYCVPKMNYNMCESDGEFAGVEVGTSSYTHCGYGMRGYKFRTCEKRGYLNKFGEQNTTACVYLPPSEITYLNSTYTFVVFSTIHIPNPTCKNVIIKFSITPKLPLGLTLNETTGAITGRSFIRMKRQSFTITGTNPSGTTEVTIQIEVISHTWRYVLLIFGILVVILIGILLLIGIVFTLFYFYTRCKTKKTMEIPSKPV